MGSLSELPVYDASVLSYALDNTIQLKEGKKYLTTGQKAVDPNTGEEFNTQLTQKVVQDKNTFKKLFDPWDILMQLKGELACKLFFYVSSNLQQNSCEIYMDTEECAQKLSCTARGYRNALYELCRMDIMRMTTTKNLFHVNPNVVFNGDRSIMLERERKKLSDANIRTPDQLIIRNIKEVEYPDGTIERHIQEIERNNK